MARHLAFGGVARPVGRSISSVACLAFVLALGTAVWTAIAWLATALLNSGAFN